MKLRALTKIRQASIRTVVACLITVTMLWWSSATVIGVQQQPEADDLKDMRPGQLFVPAPRELVRPLVRARKALAEQDYRAAVELLGEILASPLHGDYLQAMSGDRYRSVSIHNQAHQLMGQIPRKHRVDYELRYKVTARQMLEKAAREGDFTQMAQVSRHYFYTDSGYHATLLLGHHYLEVGQPVSAASCFSALVNDSYSRSNYEPEVSVLLATCWLLMGNRNEAQRVLEDLAETQSGVQVRLPDRTEQLFSNPDDAIPWLISLIGNTSLAGYKAVDDWLMFRGDQERNASSGTGFPLPYARWNVPTVNEPQHETLAAELFQARLSRSESLIPALQPIAVADTIVVRSLDQMVGIDFRTGKRVWEFPAWNRGSLLDEDRQSEQIRQKQTERWHVDQRLWRDHLFGQIASNGRHVFVIDQPGFASPVNERSVIGRGIVIENPNGGRETNELKAIDLVRQGAFCWEVGGKTGGRVPELAGCFFLGAPLVLENELYILGELGGEIRLIVLEQDSGDLIWSQQIAAIDATLPVTQDRLRRLAGATPSCSNGIIVCPTSATGIVAVERSTRSLLWGVQYPGLWTSGLTKTAQARIRAQARMQSNRQPSQSIDSTVTIADGRIVVMPIENDRILCFDLLTGKSMWESREIDGQPKSGRPIEDAQFIACVHDSQVIAVGQKKIRGLDLDSGELKWTISLDRTGQPTGRGFLSEGRYYLPTSESKIIEVDIASGKITREIDTQRVLGNLICYKGDLISQGFDVVSVYPQAQPVRDYVDEFLRTTNESAGLPAEVLNWQAQLQSQDGDLAAAVATADKAYVSTGNRREKLLLLDLILEMMETDYPAVRSFSETYASELAEYGKLKYVAALIGGLLNEGAYDEALSVLQHSNIEIHRNGTATGDEITAQYRTQESGELRIRLDSCLRKQLYDSLAKSTDTTLEQTLTVWCSKNVPTMEPERLAPFTDLVGVRYMPFDDLIRLAAWYISNREFVSAERILNEISLPGSESGRSELIAAAQIQAMTCRLLYEAGWNQRATALAIEFLTTYEKAEFPDPWSGKITSGRNFANNFLDERESRNPSNWDSWDYGRVDGGLESVQANRHFMIRTVVFPELAATTGTPPDDIRVEANIQDSKLVIRDSMGRKIGQVPYRTDAESRSYYSPRMYSGTYAMHGNLLIFSYGYDLIAVDLNLLKNNRNALLWHKNLLQSVGVNNRLNVHSGFQTKAIRNPWGQNRFVITGRDETNPVGNFASNSNQVFYRIGNAIHAVDSQTGELVWQRLDLDKPGWLVADEEALALLETTAQNALPGTFQSATLLDAGSGTKLKSIDLPTFKEQILLHNKGLKLLFTAKSRRQSLTLFDLNNEKQIWSKEWPEKTHGEFRDDSTMVILTSKGKLEYLNIATGKSEFEAQLKGINFRTLGIMQFRNHDLLLLNKDTPNPAVRPADQNVVIRAAMAGQAELFNGWIHCVDLETGTLAWQQPARVEYFAIPGVHPIDAPILTLNRLVYPGLESGGGSQNVVELYSLDLRDGRLVDIQRIRNWTLRSLEIEAQTEEQAIVHHFNDRKLTLRLSNAELPPAAPASLTNRFTIPKSKEFATGKRRANELESKQQKLIREARERNQDE